MNTRDETAPEGGSDIYIATASCRKSFETCLSIPVLMENKWAENRLLDFKLWCSGVGALASPPAGLDYRLRTQLDVRAVVLGLLSSLRTLVDFCVQHASATDVTSFPSETIASQDIGNLASHTEVPDYQADPFASWSDESSIGSENDTEDHRSTKELSRSQQSMGDVDSILDQIIRLGMVIRSSGAASRLNKADAYFTFEDYENLDNRSYVHSSRLPVKTLRELKSHLLMCLFMQPSPQNTRHLGGQERDFATDLERLEPMHRKVLARLVYTNLRRHNRFCYAQIHGQKLAAAQAMLLPMPPGQSSQCILSPMDLATNKAQSAGRRKYAGAQSMQLPSNTETVASRDLIDLSKFTAPAWGREGMSRMSVSLRKSGWPHPPPSTKERKTFQCPCCCLTLSSMEAERLQWRKHLSADLCPYACLFPDCPESNPMFVTRDMWKAHLHHKHQESQYWECTVCTTSHDVRVFSTSDEFLEHLRSQHTKVVADVDASRLLDICVRSNPSPIKICPLCISESQRADLEPEALLEHIADHLHDFALKSLPWMDATEPESSAQLSDVTTNKITKWFDTVIPSFQPEEDDQPAYPSEGLIRAAALDFPIGSTGKSNNSAEPDYSNYFAESSGGASQAQATNSSRVSIGSADAQDYTPQFIFRVDEFFDRPTKETFSSVPKSIVRVQGGVSGQWWSCDRSTIRPLADLVPSAVPYKTSSMIYKGGHAFSVLRGDATSPLPNETWHDLRFDHDEKDNSTYLTNDGTQRTISAQHPDSWWPSKLLPDIYHGSTHPHDGGGGLTGELPVFLALIALSMQPEELAKYLPTLMQNGKWMVHNRPHGRNDNRGVVIHVYAVNDNEDRLAAYENGEYGKYYD